MSAIAKQPDTGDRVIDPHAPTHCGTRRCSDRAADDCSDDPADGAADRQLATQASVGPKRGAGHVTARAPMEHLHVLAAEHATAPQRCRASVTGLYLPREVFFGRLGFAGAFVPVCESDFGRFFPATSGSFRLMCSR